MKNNKFMRNVVLYVKYPYTALIISIMWIGTALIISEQKGNNFELLVILTAICTIFIAFRGLRATK